MAKLALLIGVSEYQPGLPPLPAAVNDIEAMQRVLLDPEMGDFDNVQVLANPNRHQMASEIDSFYSERCSKQDLVVLYFSGHGIKDDQGRLYFASIDTEKYKNGNLKQTSAVSANTIHDLMKYSRCRRQAVILDCCFSGAFDPAFMSKDDGAVDLQKQLGSQGRVVLTSSSSTQYSFQEKDAELSIYTRYLVEGIETGVGETTEDGKITAYKLHEYAAVKVHETSPNMTPKFIVMKDKGFEIVLAKARITDPKLKYRNNFLLYFDAGRIRPAGRYVLDAYKQQLGLTNEEATEIEVEVLHCYQKKVANLQKYKEALVAESEREYPLSQDIHALMRKLQKTLELSEDDILPIHQEVDAQYSSQGSTYKQKLHQYKQKLTDEIERHFPLRQATYKELEQLQESLGLRTEDITLINNSLLTQAGLKYRGGRHRDLKKVATQLPATKSPLPPHKFSVFNLKRLFFVLGICFLGVLVIIFILNITGLRNKLWPPKQPRPERIQSPVPKTNQSESTPTTTRIPKSTPSPVIKPTSGPDLSAKEFSDVNLGNLSRLEANVSTVVSTTSARQIIQSWQKAKAEAMGKDHRIASLDKILAEPSLSEWKAAAQGDQANQVYREYTYDDLRINAIKQLSSTLTIVETTVTATEKVFEREQQTTVDYTDDTYRVRYEMIQKQNQWKIQRMEALN